MQIKDNKLLLSTQAVQELVCDGLEEFEVIDEITHSSKRWVTPIELIVKHIESEKYYSVVWERGNTEYQDNNYDGGWFDEVEQVEVKRYEWRVKK